MVSKYISSAILVLVIFMAGCASTKNLPTENHIPSLNMRQVKTDIELANRYLDHGDPEKAQANYQTLLDTYPELSQKYHCGLLTNAALASLQMGDSHRFAYYAKKLEAAAAGVRPLPRNTQIVLSIMNVTGMRTTKEDLWISQPVERAVRSVLTAN